MAVAKTQQQTISAAHREWPAGHSPRIRPRRPGNGALDAGSGQACGSLFCRFLLPFLSQGFLPRTPVAMATARSPSPSRRKRRARAAESGAAGKSPKAGRRKSLAGQSQRWQQAPAEGGAVEGEKHEQPATLVTSPVRKSKKEAFMDHARQTTLTNPSFRTQLYDEQPFSLVRSSDPPVGRPLIASS